MTDIPGNRTPAAKLNYSVNMHSNIHVAMLSVSGHNNNCTMETKKYNDDRPMHDKLTVLIQTSPIPSHPSTALLEALFRSFQKADGLLESQIVILADGCEEINSSLSLTSCNEGGLERENMKHGKSSAMTADNYRLYLKQLKNMLQDQTFPICPQPGGSLQLLELENRHGSARAIQVGMNHVVNTPLVMVCQHDNFFIHHVPLRDIVDAMLREPLGLGIGLKCLHFLSTSTLNYTKKVKRRYNLDLQPVMVEGLEYPLVPLAFWYGRSHITYSDYVRSYVLARPLEKGSHLEELLGEKQLHDIISRGPAAHKEYGTYVLDQGIEVIYHLSGRRAIACQELDKVSVDIEAESFDAPIIHREGPCTPPLEGAFTTARSCRAIVPGLKILSGDSIGKDKNNVRPPTKQFKQRCFHCGEKGHSKTFCPHREDQTDYDKVEIINLC
jgi:hypothetical protein